MQNAFSKHAPFPRRARMRCLSMCCSDQAARRFIDHVCKRDCSLLTHIRLITSKSAHLVSLKNRTKLSICEVVISAR